jgi:muramidase (phage lysozyme)
MNKLIIGASIIAAYLILKAANEAGAIDSYLQADGEEIDQTGNVLDQLPSIEDVINMATEQPISEDQKTRNKAAFLAALRYAEGTTGDEGYRALFGWRRGNGKVFNDFSSHPKVYFDYTNLKGKTIKTSAAGAYQILYSTFTTLSKKYGFSSFYPADQDEMALALISEKGALADVEAGRFAVAVRKVRKIWASLPDSDVDQPTRTYAQVENAYLQAGGQIA